MACDLLKALLSAKDLPDLGAWTVGDVARLFGVGNRTIYEWIANQKLAARDLPGRGRFLSEDLGWDWIIEHERELTSYALEKLSSIPGLKSRTLAPARCNSRT